MSPMSSIEDLKFWQGAEVKDTYQLVTQTNGKEDAAAIFSVLQKIRDGILKNDLRLLNYYHEVPVSYGVTIDSIEGDAVEFTVHQAQAAVLGLQKQALMKSSHFPEGLGVHCFVEYINVRNRMAILGRFAYASIRADRRNAVRVYAGAPSISTQFQTEGQCVSGELKDISVTGVAVISSAELPSGLSEEGVLKLNLMGHAMTVQAAMVRAVPVDEGRLYTFRIELDAKMEEVVSQYIYSRQVEIIRELKEHID